MEEILNTAIEWGKLYGLKVVGAVAIFIIGRFVIGIITGIVKRIMKKSKTDETLVKFLVSLTKTALLVILFIAILKR